MEPDLSASMNSSGGVSSCKSWPDFISKATVTSCNLVVFPSRCRKKDRERENQEKSSVEVGHHQIWKFAKEEESPSTLSLMNNIGGERFFLT